MTLAAFPAVAALRGGQLDAEEKVGENDAPPRRTGSSRPLARERPLCRRKMAAPRGA